ncbi:MAG TPA: hypothetical protein DCL77_17230 [Prolixibacteraceae bacterium]|jgi:hypothetical protein|nr:hypothetical protein [Prolixibacteraceae bacterium]
MKTQNNNQRTASQVSKMVLYSVVIFSVASISLTASAQDFWKQISNAGTYGKTASAVDQTSETELAGIVAENLHTEVPTLGKNSNKSFTSEPVMETTLQVEPWMTDESNFTNIPDISKVEETLEYNPQEFVNAEMAEEKENLTNENSETNVQAVEADLALQEEALSNETEYNADKFVQDEMRLENEKWMSNQDFIDAAEEYTADGSELEVAKYAQRIINASEFEKEAQLNDETFIQTAEVYTANGTEQEVAKYAQKVVNGSETEPALELEAWMTNANFFNTAELLTSIEAEQECTKYAQRQISLESFRDSK